MGLIVLGKIVNTHGFNGAIKVIPFSRNNYNLSRLNRIFVSKNQDHTPRELKITHNKEYKGSAIIRLEGVHSFEEAKKLKGSLIMVEECDLLDLDNDEYYWFQLIGLNVYLSDGKCLGIVENLIEGTHQSVLIVKNKDKEYLIPFVDTIIKEIDIEKSKIIISPIEGLLD